MNSYLCAYCLINFNSESFALVCDKCKQVDRTIIQSQHEEDRSEIAKQSLENLLQQANELEPESEPDLNNVRTLEPWTEDDAIHAEMLANIVKRIKRPNVLMPLQRSPPPSPPTTTTTTTRLPPIQRCTTKEWDEEFHIDELEEFDIKIPPLERFVTGMFVNDDDDDDEFKPFDIISRQNTMMTFIDGENTKTVINGNPDGSKLIPDNVE